MTADEIVVHSETAGRTWADSDAVDISGISASWLADELDSHGVVHLRDVFSPEWLESMRTSVSEYISRHGDGDLIVIEPERECGSPAHRLASSAALLALFKDAAALRRPRTRTAQTLRFAIPIRQGVAPKARPNLFHYDASVLTMVVPIFIPDGIVGTCGELVTFGNKRPYRRFVATHILETALTHNSLYRRYMKRKVSNAPEKHLTTFQPGDACVFWGYRTYHGNMMCEPGLLRATLVLQFGDVHADSWALKAVWRLSRSRRDMGRFQYSAPAAVPRGVERIA